MGGNALKIYGITPRRMSSSEYCELTDELVSLFSQPDSPLLSLSVVKSPRHKSSHGDIDIKGLVKSAHPSDWKRECQTFLGSEVGYSNDKTISLLYKGVQVDLEGHHHPAELCASLNYCDYSPLGNLVGALLKQAGLKWGVDGLSLPVRESTHLLGTIPVTHDACEALLLAGLDPRTWEGGFDNLEDVFTFVISSPLFNNAIFLPQNLNHTNRVRNRKREDYKAWTTFASSHPDNLTEKNKDQIISATLQKLHSRFPHVQQEEARLRSIEESRKASKRMLGGEALQDITGLKGKNLGEFLSRLTQSKGGKDNLYQWILATPKTSRDAALRNLARSLLP